MLAGGVIGGVLLGIVLALARLS
ncbi:hypothetical protein MKD33_00545, partial [Chromobacterium piscinae]